MHGGGKLASQLAAQLGVESKMFQGRRITDADTLKIVTMVYAGLTNKNIVAQLQKHNCNAIGLSGADGNAIEAHKRPVRDIDFGYAGDIEIVNGELLSKLLNFDLTPVFCALTHNGHGQLLNTNADTIAAELAIGMSDAYATTLYYCFERKGVLMNVDDDDSVLEHIDSTSYEKLLLEDVIADGMLPKMQNSFHALKNNVQKVCIGDMKMLDPHAKRFTTLTL